VLLISWNQRKNKSRIEQQDTRADAWLQNNVLDHKFPALITIGALCTCEVREAPPELEPFIVKNPSGKPVRGATKHILLNLPGIRTEGNPSGYNIKVDDMAPFRPEAKSRIPTVILAFSEVFIFDPTFMSDQALIEASLLKYFIH